MTGVADSVVMAADTTGNSQEGEFLLNITVSFS